MTAAGHLERAARRIRAGLDALADELPRPADGEHLVQCGESGNYFTSRDLTDRKWLGLTGFLAGRYWLMYVHTGADRYRDVATEISLLHRRTMGSSLINETFSAQFGPALGFRLTGDDRLRTLALATSRELAADFWPPLELFLRWPTGPGRPDRASMSRLWNVELDEYVATVDECAGAAILYWSGAIEPGHRDAALRAQRALSRHGMIAPDGKVTQAITSDGQGRNVRLASLQGSTRWTRAQAWGVLAAVDAYQASGRPEFLDTARAALGYYWREIIGDRGVVPGFDAAAAGRDVPRDTCSAAIVAAAMVRLAALDPGTRAEYAPLIERTVVELVDHHLTPGGTLLHGCWGNLREGAREHVMPFGNYYFTEVVVRLLGPEHPVWRVEPP